MVFIEGERNIVKGPSRFELSVALFEKAIPSQRRSLEFELEKLPGTDHNNFIRVVVTSCTRVGFFGHDFEIKGLIDQHEYCDYYQEVMVVFDLDGQTGTLTVSGILTGNNPDQILNRYQFRSSNSRD